MKGNNRRVLIRGLAVLALLYFCFVITPALIVLSQPCDGTPDEVTTLLEHKSKVLSQWSPITGFWELVVGK